MNENKKFENKKFPEKCFKKQPDMLYLYSADFAVRLSEKRKRRGIMNESYAEVLIKRKREVKYMAIVAVMMILTVAMLAAGLLIEKFLFIPGIVLLFVDNFVVQLLCIEYEYLYVSGELSIDRIVGKNKRKNCMTADMEKVELIAPEGSGRFDALGGLKCVEKDFTSCRDAAKVYICIFHTEKEVWKVRFEPDGKMLELMRQTFPRKVSLV